MSDTHPRAQQVQPPRGSTAARAADLYEQHGADLYALALVLLGDRAAAEDVVTETVVDEAAQSSRSQGTEPVRAKLAHAVFSSCRGLVPTEAAVARSQEAPTDPALHPLRSIPPAERAALALAWYGHGDYRWVASVMAVAPVRSAQLMRAGLAAIA